MTSSNAPKTLHDRQLDRVQLVLENEEIELTKWETDFCTSVHSQMLKYADRELSDKQLAIIEKLEGYIINGRPNTR